MRRQRSRSKGRRSAPAAPRSTERRAAWSARSWVLVTLLAATVVAACNSSDNPTGSSNGECAGPNDLGSCPSWSSYSPQMVAQDPDVTDTPPVVQEQAADLQRFDDDTGDLVDLGNVTFVCTTQEYDFVNNPQKALSFNIDETVVWPGALIQGKSHRDATAASGGVGAILELPIRERTPVEVTLTFNNTNSSVVVSNPTTGTVGDAVHGMIGSAEAQGLATANNISFSQETYTSEQQAATAFKVSGRYLGFEASASGSVSKTVNTNIIAARLEQQMYVVNVTQPATPSAFFSADAGPAFQTQVDLGRVGPGNPPLYVSRIGYGRMMVFSMSAKAEADEIKGAIRAAYENIGGDIDATVTHKQRNILSTAEIRISQIGGDQSNALAAIKSGVLADYFTNTVPLTAAQPIWFELKSLTGEVAYVSEPGTYTETTCVPKLPGTFDYADEQSVSIPFTAGTERTTLQGDVNGDGRMDLIFNERQSAGGLNKTHVLLADGSAQFSLAGSWSYPGPAPAEGWEQFDHVRVADIDGDGKSDLVWNALTPTNNIVYTAISVGDGTFVERARQERPATGWAYYEVQAGDLDADGKDDLLWSNAGKTGSSTLLRTYYALAQDDTTFDMTAGYVDRAGNYSGYASPVLAQLDGANGKDFVINALGSSYNNAYVGRFTPTSETAGTISFPTPFVATQDGWGDYRMRVGNVDGQNGADLVFVNKNSGRTYHVINKGDGTFLTNTPPYQDNILANNTPFLADFNNDGKSDLLLVSLSPDTNQLITGFGLTDGSFTFPAGVQTHPDVPSSGWATFDTVFVGDVNGDGKADVVWTNPAGTAEIYVALSK